MNKTAVADASAATNEGPETSGGQPARASNIDAIVAYFESGITPAGTAGELGIELEHTLVHDDMSPVAYSGPYGVEWLLGQLEARAARNGYQLTHTPRVGAVLAARARSPYGARELRRQVDRAVEQALANQIASGTAHTGQHWTADCTVDGAIVLEEGEAVEQTIG